jgi:hypothetical protein
MRIGAEGKLDGRQCFSVPNEEKGERRKEKRGEGVRERARRCEGNIWERERFDHVDAADSWAKEGDAKRLHNRPCGRSLGKVLGRVVVVSTGHRERVNTRALVVGREINAEAEGCLA